MNVFPAVLPVLLGSLLVIWAALLVWHWAGQWKGFRGETAQDGTTLGWRLIVVKHTNAFYHLHRRTGTWTTEDWLRVYNHTGWDGTTDGTLYLLEQVQDQWKEQLLVRGRGPRKRHKCDSTCPWGNPRSYTSLIMSSGQEKR